MSNYIPENNYPANNFQPIGQHTEDMCTRCERYYKTLFDSKLTKSPFPPSCEKHVANKIRDLVPSDFSDIREYEDATLIMDPIAWAAAEFGWEARFYQVDMLSCTSKNKIYRMGRRVGKSEALVIETLHHITTNKNHTVLIIAPYERQVTRLFDEMNKFINMSATLKGSISRITKTPSRIDFQNGSKVLGFSAGATSSSGSDKIRGQDAHLIVIDEIDTLEDKDIDAVMAILASHSDCRLVAASTPRGWRRRFYTYVTNKNLGFKEFWYISAESPEWTKETEAYFKESTDVATYTHEYLADFAELEEGVFKARLLNASIQDYDTAKYEYKPSADYILGVDWNKSAGTHMVIIEWWGGKLRLAKKIIVDESQYTQTDSVELIKVLNRQWRFKYIFVDRGYGQVQAELLKKHSVHEPSSMFDVKLFDISMNQHLEILDPISGEKLKKNAKHFLIEQTRKLLEDGYLILPKSEDTAISTNNAQMGLVQQMRNFRIEALSTYGLPRYSQGQDHTLAAYYLACGGFYWKEGDLKGMPYNQHISGVEISDDIKPDTHPSILEREQDVKSGWVLRRTTGKIQKESSLKSRSLGGKSYSPAAMNNLKRNIEERSRSRLPKKGGGEGYSRGNF